MRTIKTLAWTTATCALLVAACSVVYPLSDYTGTDNPDAAAGCGSYDQSCCTANKCTGALICGASDKICKSCVKALSLGRDHGCVLKEDASLWCWGSGKYGALGVINENGQMPLTAAKARQVTTSAGTSFKSVGAGGYHTCAIDTNDLVWCWGQNSTNQTGSANPPQLTSTPVKVDINGQKAKTVTGGYGHSCAILDDDTLWCWGANEGGQLGRTVSSPSQTPSQVGLSSFKVKDISLGDNHSCAVTLEGDVYCWGSENNCAPNGDCGNKLGDGSATAAAPGTLIRVAGPEGSTYLSGIAKVGAGKNFTCAQTEAGELYCWGDARYGQMGDGTSKKTAPSHKLPTLVPGLGGQVSQMAVGPGNICVITTDGKVWCWGENNWGQVANGTKDPQSDAIDPDGVSIPNNITGLSTNGWLIGVGGNHSCAATKDKAIWCWGGNKEGQLGYPKDPGLERNFQPLQSDGVSGPCP